MEENKTGVWVRTKNGQELKYNSRMMKLFDVGDIVEVDNDDVYAKFKIEIVELKNASRIVATYTIKPQCKIIRTTHPWRYAVLHDAEPIEMDVCVNDKMLVIVPPWYKKEQYRNQRIQSTEASITITRKGSVRTMNENLEVQRCTIPADKIKVDTLNISDPEVRWTTTSSDRTNSMTATSEAEKNWNQNYYGIFGAQRGLRLQTQIYDGWANDVVDKLSKYAMITPIRVEENIKYNKEKDMNTKNLKEMIKKPIYVDKEITVKEPMLDNNGKQIEKDGKPVFKVKHYHGMVKILWTSGAETVAYVEGNDVYDRENGFKTCVLKYLFGNADAHDAVDFWTNKYVKYPSSCIEVTENLCKLEKILENDKKREEERKGLPHAKFLRRIGLLSGGCVAGKLIYKNCDMKYVNEFKKLAKKYFPELKGKEIYVNGNKNDEIFVAIK